MSHLGRAIDFLDVVEEHLELAKDDPECPVQVIDFWLSSLHDIKWLIEYHRRALERRRREAERARRRQYPPGGNP